MTQIIEKNINELVPYEKNPRYNENAVDYVAKSIQQFGWKVPIVIDKNNVIVTGHTRYKAAQLLGIKTIPCIVADDLTDAQIKAYRIADNKVADFSIWDNKLLLDELDKIESLDADLFTGFTLGDTFDILDEKDKDPVVGNEFGMTYELVLKSDDREKLKEIQRIWEDMCDGNVTTQEVSYGEHISGRNIR